MPSWSCFFPHLRLFRSLPWRLISVIILSSLTTGSVAQLSLLLCLPHSHGNKLFIRLEMDAMMDRIFICEQEQHYATKKLIPNPPSSIIRSGNEALHWDVIRWNKQHITGPLAQHFLSWWIRIHFTFISLVSFFKHLREINECCRRSFNRGMHFVFAADVLVLFSGNRL